MRILFGYMGCRSMITIRFLGYKDKRKKGCPVCGGSRSGNATIRRRQVINIPGGRKIDFMIGREYEVTEAEWEYLSEIPDSFVKV